MTRRGGARRATPSPDQPTPRRSGRRAARAAGSSRSLGVSRASVGIASLSAVAVAVVGFLTLGGGALAGSTDKQSHGGVARAPISASGRPSTPTAPTAPTQKPSTEVSRYVRDIRSTVVKGTRLTMLPSPDELTARMKAKGWQVGRPHTRPGGTFTVASFNMLGASHTGKGGNKKGYAGGPARVGGEVAMLRKHGVSVAGLQEFEASQVNAFRAQTGWTVFPGGSVANSMVWNPAVWETVETHTMNVPYFGGRPVAMPHVKLRLRSTGQEVWFGTYHNPADTRGAAGGLRARATAMEANLMNRLTADGTPMIITGDMNDRAPFGCAFTKMTGGISAEGVHYDGGCTGGPMFNVDWIVGSPGMQFGGFVTDFASEHRRLSDHPLVKASATVPSGGKPTCVRKRSTEGELLFCRR